MPVTRHLGSVSVVALHDGSGPFFEPREKAFPTATAEHWARADGADPDAVTADGRWLLRFRCFAVRYDDGPVVLVDTGIGPADAPAASWAPVPGRLPEELATVGIAPADVDTVVLTHLHTDHVGWAVVGAPYFPRARYLLQRDEADAVDRINPALDGRLLDPLRDSGQLWLGDGETALARGLRAVPTPGHTPGHQSVLLEAGRDTVLITGDLLVHALQLIAPELPYSREVDPDGARASRTALLDDLRARDRATLATSHLSAPFTPYR